MKASRATAKTMRSVEGLEQQMQEVLSWLERIEAKIDALMFPEPAEEPKPAAKGK